MPRYTITSMRIKQILAKDCYSLRESVLRPGQPKENWTFKEDDNKKTLHLGMEHDGEIIAIVSLLPEEKEGSKYRLRGMAVQEEFRGQGIGQQLLVALLEKTGESVWCTARKQVQGFYSKNSFEVFGDEFTMNDMPHVFMQKV